VTAPVQSAQTESAASATTLGVAQGSNPTVGNTNVVWVTCVGYDATTVTVADSQGNTYTARGSVREAVIDAGLFQFTGPITTSGANTVTATFSPATTARQIAVVEVDGVYDVHNTGTDSGNDPTTSLSATNTAQPATVWMACVFWQGGTPGVGTGYTDSGLGGIWAAGYDGRVQYKEVTSVASQSGNFVNASLDRSCYGIVILTDGSGQPTINTQPADQTVYEGNAASFSVSATTSGGTLHYQWKDDGSNVGTDSNTYGPTPAASDNLSMIKCDVSDDNGTITTRSAVLRVIPTARLGWRRA
jgi:hypothetical protein